MHSVTSLLQAQKTKKRWKKKIGGEEYVTDEEDEVEAAAEATSTPSAPMTEGAAAAGVASMSLNKGSMEYVQNDFRRRKCSDLKSVSERKAEMAAHELLMRDYL